jgi:CubicO group peptidase (beta-lactamase class C family)
VDGRICGLTGGHGPAVIYRPYFDLDGASRSGSRADSPGVPETIEMGEGSSIELDEALSGSDTIAFLILKEDVLVYERYYQGHSAEALLQAFSASKSITSALVGAAVADGYFRATDQLVTDFVPELAVRGFDNVTIGHLLTMTSGSNYVENENPFEVHVLFNYTPDLEKMMLDF